MQQCNCPFYITILTYLYSIPCPYEQYQVDKGVLVAEWGQFQSLDLNDKPSKNKLLFFNKKNLTLKL
jgi:hypothetical protein